MQTWHCIALLVLSIGVFLYATYLRDVKKSTELSLDDLAEWEKRIASGSYAENENKERNSSSPKDSTWVRRSLILRTDAADKYVISYHQSAIEGVVFRDILLEKLAGNPNAKDLILGIFTNELFNHSPKDILSSLISTKRKGSHSLEIICKGHTERASAVLAEFVQREYKKSIMMETKDNPLLPSLADKLAHMDKMEKESSEIKVYLSNMLEDNPEDSIEAMTLRSEILQLDQEIENARTALKEIDSIHREQKSPMELLSVKAIDEFGKVNEFSTFLTRLKKMSNDSELDQLTLQEVRKNLKRTSENLEKEVIKAIDSIKLSVKSLLDRKSELQQNLTDHVIGKRQSLSLDPRVERLNQIRDELMKAKAEFEDELLRWMNCKNSFEILRDS